MKLCTDKVVADWLALTPKRVKQLRDEGVLIEKSPGLYDLRASVLRYVNYIRTGNRADLNGERALLTKAKREAADMENDVRRGTLHSSEDIETMSENMEYKPNVKVEGKQTEERRHVVAFKRPYVFEQKEYTEVDLGGLDALTVKDAIEVQKQLFHPG